MSRLIQFVCLNDDCNSSCVSYPDMVPRCNSCQTDMASVPALKAENERLRQIIREAMGPTMAWAARCQNRSGRIDLHPRHQDLLDRMTAAVNKTDGE